MYANGSSTPGQMIPSVITFQGSMIFQTLTATSGGGGFYLDNPQMSVLMTTSVTLTGATTTAGNGGVFYIANLGTLDFRQTPATAFSTYQSMTVPQPFLGSFIYSSALGATFYLSNLDIACQSTPLSYAAISSYLSTADPLYGGAMYI